MTLAQTSVKLPRGKVSLLGRQLQVVVGILTIAALVSPNPLLSLASLTTFAFIWVGATSNPVKLIIAASLSVQWLQVTMKIYVANVMGIDLGVVQAVRLGQTGLLEVTDNMQSAILLGLSCLAALSFGFRMLAPQVSNFRPNLGNLSPGKLMLLYFGLWALSLISGPFSGGGLAQPLIVLGWLRFAPAVLILFRWLTLRDSPAPLLIIIAVEIITGFLGYFSGFRVIFFIFGPAMLTLHQVLERRAIKTLSIACVVLLLLGSFWTVIKPTYRAALNLGSNTQVVSLSVEDRITLLADLANNIQSFDLVDGLIGMAQRLSYVDYLADVLHNIPALMPHQEGQLWGEAFSNILIPRILFPEKSILPSDSERTMRYTGRVLGSDREGTSISMGYVADSYVDFGLAGALFVSMLIGASYALIARHIVSLNRGREFSVVVAILAVNFFVVQEFEISNVKLLGGVIWSWAVSAFFIRYCWPQLRRFCIR